MSREAFGCSFCRISSHLPTPARNYPTPREEALHSATVAGSVALPGSKADALPLAVGAQTPAVGKIGYLHPICQLMSLKFAAAKYSR